MKPKTKADWEGRVVWTARQMSNGWGVIPENTPMVVKKKHGTLTLESLHACGCCGLRARISDVPLGAVFVEEPKNEVR